ncbi:MAG: thermonuclease family protein [Acidimicrobiales bacterium]|jgi:micrococcal nuclease|nr:thermonuclease family protein [Acidimicrobiales bacterium]
MPPDLSPGDTGLFQVVRVHPIEKVATMVVGVVIGLTILGMGLAACSRDQPPSAGLGTVVGVIDGDTVVIDLSGNDEIVRLLGIDTPETVHPDRPVECFGSEASARMALLLPPGTAVLVQRDVEARDRYGRLLAYIERLSDGLAVNASMVERGFAASLHISPNDGLRHELAAAESRARAAGLGLWSACGGAHEPLS